MTSRQQTSILSSFKPYFINTRKTKRDVDLTPIGKLIAKLLPISANEQPGFSGQPTHKKGFPLNNSRDNFILNFNLNCRLSGLTT